MQKEFCASHRNEVLCTLMFSPGDHFFWFTQYAPRGSTLRRSFRTLLFAILAVCGFGCAGLHCGDKAVQRAAKKSIGTQTQLAVSPTRSIDLKILRLTLQEIQKNYVDPERIHPDKMLVGGLDALQKQVAELQVEPDLQNHSVLLRVNKTSQTFALPTGSSLDQAWESANQIFAFVVAQLPSDFTDKMLQDLLYTAINGMLSTLDPHTILFDPETLKDFMTSTRGSFGGLGMMLRMRRNAITVVRTYPNTPAEKAGLARGTKILKINGVATEHMDLSEAVNRMRGEPGTKVNLCFQAPEKQATPLVCKMIERKEISIDPVDSYLLQDKTGVSAQVGYIRLRQFSSGSASKVAAALQHLKEEAAEANAKNPSLGLLKGLILDLHGNPGGLMEEATGIADLFLDAGPVVATVTQKKLSFEKASANADDDTNLPLVVLVDGRSASASEIVAGALKNRNRALVIGTTTFGKGSVQVISEHLGLKLTIAQYLTPGEISIQSVGVVPDVALQPMWASKNNIRLFNTPEITREKDLESHLNSKYVKPEKATYFVRYVDESPVVKPTNVVNQNQDPTLTAPKEEEEDSGVERDEWDDLSATHWEQLYPINLSVQLFRESASSDRKAWLARLVDKMNTIQEAEWKKLAEQLSPLGVDWTPLPPSVPPVAPILDIKFTTGSKDSTVQAGKSISFVATLTNKGAVSAGQVHAKLSSDLPLFDGKELVFGRIDPGQTKTAKVEVPIPLGFSSIQVPVSLQVQDQISTKYHLKNIFVQVDGQPLPKFSYQFYVLDSPDGHLRPNTPVRLRVNFKNMGPGVAPRPQVYLVSNRLEDVSTDAGRFALPSLAVGQESSVEFSFELKPSFSDDSVRFMLGLYDEKLNQSLVSDQIRLLVETNPIVEKRTPGRFVVGRTAMIQDAAYSEGQEILQATEGTCFPATGFANQWVRLSLGEDRIGFVEPQQGLFEANKPCPSAQTQFDWLWQVSPPKITIQTLPLRTKQESVPIHVLAEHPMGLRDAYIEVRNLKAKADRKVFYRNNQNGPVRTRMTLDHQIRLGKGINLVRVVVRRSFQVQSDQTAIIYKE